MIIQNTTLHRAAIITMEPIHDQRGFFARSFCKDELAKHSIPFDIVQCNIAFNHKARTLRGMHFQKPPFCEDKFVSCTSGSIYDVIIDLNRDSPSFGQWYGITLSADVGKSLYVPQGFAHGYQTLTENSSVAYMLGQFYTPSHESGVRWDDPAFGIAWPYQENIIISEKDQTWKDFRMDTDGMIL